MSFELCLGVIDQMYTTPEKGYQKYSPHKSFSGGYKHVSTGDVAEWLEEQYHIMEMFYVVHEKEILQRISDAAQANILNIIVGSGGSGELDLALAPVLTWIEHKFKNFLAMQEMDGLGIPGVPTQASLDGVSHRFKSGYNWVWQKTPGGKRKKVHGVPRPSFIDTGLYQASFKAWVDENT